MVSVQPSVILHLHDSPLTGTGVWCANTAHAMGIWIIISHALKAKYVYVHFVRLKNVTIIFKYSIINCKKILKQLADDFKCGKLNDTPVKSSCSELFSVTHRSMLIKLIFFNIFLFTPGAHVPNNFAFYVVV